MTVFNRQFEQSYTDGYGSTDINRGRVKDSHVVQILRWTRDAAEGRTVLTTKEALLTFAAR